MVFVKLSYINVYWHIYILLSYMLSGRCCYSYFKSECHITRFIHCSKLRGNNNIDCVIVYFCKNRKFTQKNICNNKQGNCTTRKGPTIKLLVGNIILVPFIFLCIFSRDMSGLIVLMPLIIIAFFLYGGIWQIQNLADNG